MKLQTEIVSKVLIVYVLLQPFLDIFTGIMTKSMGNTMSIGVVIRTAFMVAIVLYSLFVAKKKDKVKLLIYYGSVAIYSLTFLLMSYKEFGLTKIFIQIKGIIKTFYFPIVLVALYGINKEKEINVDSRICVYTLFAYTFTIFFGKITGLAFDSYNTIKQSAGSVGFFYAANEIGAILCILAPILISDIIKNKGNLVFNIVSLFLLLFSIFEMGTKVPFIGVAGLLIGCIIVSFIMFSQKKEKEYLKKAICTIMVIVICLFVTGYTPVGINLEDTYGPIFPKLVKVSDDTDNVKNSNEIDSFEEFQNVLISKRDDVMEINKEKFFNQNVLTKVFGIGYLNDDEGEIQETKLIEMDYFDIFFNHGIIGSVIFFVPMLVLLFSIVKIAICNIKRY